MHEFNSAFAKKLYRHNPNDFLNLATKYEQFASAKSSIVPIINNADGKLYHKILGITNSHIICKEIKSDANDTLANFVGGHITQRDGRYFLGLQILSDFELITQYDIAEEHNESYHLSVCANELLLIDIPNPILFTKSINGVTDKAICQLRMPNEVLKELLNTCLMELDRLSLAVVLSSGNVSTEECLFEMTCEGIRCKGHIVRKYEERQSVHSWPTLAFNISKRNQPYTLKLTFKKLRA